MRPVRSPGWVGVRFLHQRAFGLIASSLQAGEEMALSARVRVVLSNHG